MFLARMLAAELFWRHRPSSHRRRRHLYNVAHFHLSRNYLLHVAAMSGYQWRDKTMQTMFTFI